MPQLETALYIPQLFWLVVSFGLLFLGMYFLINPKISAIFHHRKKKMEDRLTEVNELKNKTERVLHNIAQIEAHQKAATEDILLQAQSKALKYLRLKEEERHRDFLQQMTLIDQDLAARPPKRA